MRCAQGAQLGSAVGTLVDCGLLPFGVWRAGGAEINLATAAMPRGRLQNMIATVMGHDLSGEKSLMYRTLAVCRCVAKYEEGRALVIR